MLVLLLASSFGLSSCKKEQPVNRFQEEINQLKTENAKLRAEVDQLKTQLDNPVAQLSPSPKPVAVALNAPKPVAFEDIQGVAAQKQITQLGQLGVFDTTSGKFDPKAPITRAEFVRWLVRTNNALFPESSDKTIRLSEAGKATFSDVPSTHPDFPYIQGLANAGYSISDSDDEKTFKPEQVLTREQMLAMKVALDHRVPLESYKGGAPGGWTDSNKISKKYWPAIYVESVFQNNANIRRTFGSLKTFNPQAAVTRSEAVLCISAMGDNVAGFTTAEEALEKVEPKSSP